MEQDQTEAEDFQAAAPASSTVAPSAPVETPFTKWKNSLQTPNQGAMQVHTPGIGFPSDTEEKANLANQAGALSINQLREMDVRSNQPTSALTQYLSDATIPADPNFKPEDHLKELEQAGIDHSLYNGFLRTTSQQAFDQYKTELFQEQKDKAILGQAGWRGLVADGLAGITDPITLATMFATGPGEGIVGGAIQGGKIMGITSGINAAARPTGDWRDIPEATLGGMAFGGAFGAIGGKAEADSTFHDLNASADAVRAEFRDASKSGWAGKNDPRVFDKPEPLIKPEPIQPSMNPEASVGAASTKPSIKEEVAPSTNDLIKASQEYMAKTDWVNRMEFRDTPGQKAAGVFYDVLKNTPLASDWDKLANSNSSILQMYAHKMLESPSGLVRNNASGAALRKYYETNLLDVNRSYTKAFNDYADAQGKNFMDFEYHSTLPEAFDREVVSELNARYHDNGASAGDSSPQARQLADTIDHYSDKAVDYQKGVGDEIPVRGSEDLEKQSGWFRQTWRGDKMRDIMKESPKNKQNIIDGIANAYQRIYQFKPEDAQIYAKAVVRRSLSIEDGTNANLLHLLKQDGQAQFEQLLRDNNVPVEKIKSLMDTMRGQDTQKGAPGFLKHRLDVDLREKIPGTDKSLLDLVDTNVQKVWSRYARGVSGASAAARHGIQIADSESFINAAKQELAAKGDESVPKVLLDNLFSPFKAGPIAGGMSRTTIMAMRLTNLAVLGNVGLTKIAETGVLIGAVGLKAFVESGVSELKSMFSGVKTPIVKELETWSGPVGDTHLLYNDKFTFEMMKEDATVPNQLTHYMEGMINKGQRLQGYVSLFYQIHAWQQRVAVGSMVTKLAQLMKGDINSAQAARLYDIGLDAKTAERIQGYFRDTVSYDDKGDLSSLNMDKWNPVDVRDFRLALNRHTYNTIQQITDGEGSMWWHKDAGAVFMQLKQFTLGTVQKQVLRNMRFADAESTGAVTYGLMTAAMAYAAKQAVTGNTQNLKPEKVIKGAVELSNFTAMIPGMADPIMTLMGKDNWRFDHYGQTDISSKGILPIPVVFPTINRLAHVPGALFGLATGHYTKSDVHALQALPIVGNAPGMGAIWNAMYTDAKGKK